MTIWQADAVEQHNPYHINYKSQGQDKNFLLADLHLCVFCYAVANFPFN